MALSHNYRKTSMKQKLVNMLILQDSMNTKVNLDWRSAGNEWYRAIWMEASEMLEHYGWKWWKKQEPDMMQVKLEVVDIVHFALSIRLEQNKSLEESAQLIADDFANPMQAEDIRKTIECLALVTLTDQGAHFSFIAGIMKYLSVKMYLICSDRITAIKKVPIIRCGMDEKITNILPI